MTQVLCHIPQFCLILKIIYSVTKYLIKHPVVYSLSSVPTLKILMSLMSLDIHV